MGEKMVKIIFLGNFIQDIELGANFADHEGTSCWLNIQAGLGVTGHESRVPVQSGSQGACESFESESRPHHVGIKVLMMPFYDVYQTLNHGLMDAKSQSVLLQYVFFIMQVRSYLLGK